MAEGLYTHVRGFNNFEVPENRMRDFHVFFGDSREFGGFLGIREDSRDSSGFQRVFLVKVSYDSCLRARFQKGSVVSRGFLRFPSLLGFPGDS